MFSRSSIRHLKHKAKKSVLLRIGKTESSQEDPAFKDLIANVDLVRIHLKDMHNSSRLAVVTGRQYIDSLAKFCGDRLRGEDLYNKEAVFLRLLEDRVCPAIGSLLNKDLEKMRELIVEYKTAKLKLDRANFKTQKEVEKMGDSTENDDEMKQVNEDLQALKDSYIASKVRVTEQRDALLSHLDTKLGATVEELKEASDTEQHQLYCQYIKEKISKTAKMCIEGSTNPFKPIRSKSMIMSQSPLIEHRNAELRDRSFSENIPKDDDKKGTFPERTSPLIVEEMDEDDDFKTGPTSTNMSAAVVRGSQIEEDDGSTSPEMIASKPVQMYGEQSQKSGRLQKEKSGSPREESL